MLCATPRGLLRGFQFWAEFSPIVKAYKEIDAWKEARLAAGADPDELKAELEARRASTHEAMAPLLLRALLKLRGVYLKMGQVCSSLPIIPIAYRRELKVLQNGVPPRPPAEIHKLVETALGRPMASLFRTFDDTPVGAATVGQVHRAVTCAGETVVVKVRYPEVALHFESDTTNVLALLKLLAPAQVANARHYCDVLLRELDFTREAAVLTRVANNMAVFGEDVAVPRPVAGLVSRSVLGMTYLPGATLSAELEKLAEEAARDLGVSVDDFKRSLGEQAATGSRRSVVSRLRLLFTLRRTLRSPQARRIARYLRLLVRVLGHQLLRDGLYSSDPHPGNLLLLPDGRLGLIDFGQASSLTKPQRLLLAKVVVAVADDDEPSMARLALELGIRTKNCLPSSLAFHLKAPWGRVPPAAVFAEFERLGNTDPMCDPGDGEVLVALRPVTLVMAFCRLMGWHVKMCDAFRPLALTVLAENGLAAPRRPSAWVRWAEAACAWAFDAGVDWRGQLLAAACVLVYVVIGKLRTESSPLMDGGAAGP